METSSEQSIDKDSAPPKSDDNPEVKNLLARTAETARHAAIKALTRKYQTEHRPATARQMQRDLEAEERYQHRLTSHNIEVLREEQELLKEQKRLNKKDDDDQASEKKAQPTKQQPGDFRDDTSVQSHEVTKKVVSNTKQARAQMRKDHQSEYMNARAFVNAGYLNICPEITAAELPKVTLPAKKSGSSAPNQSPFRSAFPPSSGIPFSNRPSTARSDTTKHVVGAGRVRTSTRRAMSALVDGVGKKAEDSKPEDVRDSLDTTPDISDSEKQLPPQHSSFSSRPGTARSLPSWIPPRPPGSASGQHRFSEGLSRRGRGVSDSEEAEYVRIQQQSSQVAELQRHIVQDKNKFQSLLKWAEHSLEAASALDETVKRSSAAEATTRPSTAKQQKVKAAVHENPKKELPGKALVGACCIVLDALMNSLASHSSIWRQIREPLYKSVFLDYDDAVFEAQQHKRNSDPISSDETVNQNAVDFWCLPTAAAESFGHYELATEALQKKTAEADQYAGEVMRKKRILPCLDGMLRSKAHRQTRNLAKQGLIKWKIWAQEQCRLRNASLAAVVHQREQRIVTGAFKEWHRWIANKCRVAAEETAADAMKDARIARDTMHSAVSKGREETMRQLMEMREKYTEERNLREAQFTTLSSEIQAQTMELGTALGKLQDREAQLSLWRSMWLQVRKDSAEAVPLESVTHVIAVDGREMHSTLTMLLASAPRLKPPSDDPEPLHDNTKLTLPPGIETTPSISADEILPHRSVSTALALLKDVPSEPTIAIPSSDGDSAAMRQRLIAKLQHSVEAFLMHWVNSRLSDIGSKYHLLSLDDLRDGNIYLCLLRWMEKSLPPAMAQVEGVGPMTYDADVTECHDQLATGVDVHGGINEDDATLETFGMPPAAKQLLSGTQLQGLPPLAAREAQQLFLSFLRRASVFPIITPLIAHCPYGANHCRPDLFLTPSKNCEQWPFWVLSTLFVLHVSLPVTHDFSKLCEFSIPVREPISIRALLSRPVPERSLQTFGGQSKLSPTQKKSPGRRATVTVTAAAPQPKKPGLKRKASLSVITSSGQGGGAPTSSRGSTNDPRPSRYAQVTLQEAKDMLEQFDKEIELRDVEKAQADEQHQSAVVAAYRDALQQAAVIDVDQIAEERTSFEGLLRRKNQWLSLARLVSTAVVEFNCLEFDCQKGTFKHDVIQSPQHNKVKIIEGEQRGSPNSSQKIINPPSLDIGMLRSFDGELRRFDSRMMDSSIVPGPPRLQSNNFLSALLMSDQVMASLTTPVVVQSPKTAKGSKSKKN